MSFLAFIGIVFAAIVAAQVGVVITMAWIAGGMAHDDAAVERDARGER